MFFQKSEQMTLCADAPWLLPDFGSINPNETHLFLSGVTSGMAGFCCDDTVSIQYFQHLPGFGGSGHAFCGKQHEGKNGEENACII